MELFLNLIDNPMDDHENDIDIVHEFEDLIDEELNVIEEFYYINNQYFLQ
jgi:hypothetical protein